MINEIKAIGCYVALEIAARTESAMRKSLRSGAGIIQFLNESWRPVSSIASPIDSLETTSSVSSETLENGNFKREITELNRSGNREAQRTSIAKLRYTAKKLYKLNRFHRALEVLMSIETQTNSRMLPSDHALKMELTIKLHGLPKAEEFFFTQLPNLASQKASSLPLLHGYVKEKNTEKAESFMSKLKNSGLVTDPHLYNEMMKLYVSTSQLEKVPLVIKDMKQNQIMRNVLSYNLWMNACSEIHGVESVELVYKEMMNDNNIQVGWSGLSTLANVYINAGLVDKAFAALKDAEKKLNGCNRFGYLFLITLYASLNNKEGVLRLWRGSRIVSGRATCANYMCVLLCLVKLGDIVEAERIFKEWERDCRSYDIRVSNVLLGAYVRHGLLEKAESLHLRTLEKGGSPNYKTWEILMEGWVRRENMDDFRKILLC